MDVGKLSDLDIVYTVKKAEENEELRYSLRSLKNIPHRNLYIVGYKPSWVTNVIHIPLEQTYGHKVANTNANWLKVATTKDVSSRFILMNDDFYCMKPVTEIPFLHLGSHAKFSDKYHQAHPNSSYTKVIRNTTRRLQELGIEQPKSYELHTPTIISKQAIRIALLGTSFRFAPFNIRTLALNLMEAGGTRSEDVKFYSNHETSKNPKTPMEEMTFISTMDGGWISDVGSFIRSKLKGKCKYER